MIKAISNAANMIANMSIVNLSNGAMNIIELRNADFSLGPS